MKILRYALYALLGVAFAYFAALCVCIYSVGKVIKDIIDEICEE